MVIMTLGEMHGKSFGIKNLGGKAFFRLGKRMKRAITFLVTIPVSFIIGNIISQHKQEEKNLLLEERADKNASIIKIFNLWMEQKQKNNSIKAFFEKNNIYEIAIYGMHYLGERLVDELQDSGIIVKYAIDRSINNGNTGINMVRPDSKLEKVDAIIVTPVFYFDEIERQLKQKVKCPIISLEDVIKHS